MTNSQLTTERLEIMLAETLGTTAARGEHASIEVTASIFISVLTEVLESRKAESQIVGYFAYDNDGGFTNFDTAERAQKEAQDAIEYFRESACDGWSDGTDSVCWGAIIQQSTKTGERPVGPDDSVDDHISSICDYVLMPELPEKSK